MKNESINKKGILALKEEYEKKQKSLKMIIGFKEHTIPVIFYEGYLEHVEQSIKDLEELLKMSLYCPKCNNEKVEIEKASYDSGIYITCHICKQVFFKEKESY